MKGEKEAFELLCNKCSDKAIMLALDGKTKKGKYNFVCNLHKFLNYQRREHSARLAGKHCEWNWSWLLHVGSRCEWDWFAHEDAFLEMFSKLFLRHNVLAINGNPQNFSYAAVSSKKPRRVLSCHSHCFFSLQQWILQIRCDREKHKLFLCHEYDISSGLSSWARPRGRPMTC